MFFTTSALAKTPQWVSDVANHNTLQNVKPEDRNDAACMALAIYYEARGESDRGKKAVGNVIMNRTKSSKYPDTACGVLFQKGQFTFVHGRIATPRGTMWETSMKIASAIIAGNVADVTNGALSFCQRRLRRNAYVIGDHAFY